MPENKKVRTKVTSFRPTISERETIDERALAARMKRGKYIRKAVLEYDKLKRENTSLKRRITKLNAQFKLKHIADDIERIAITTDSLDLAFRFIMKDRKLVKNYEEFVKGERLKNWR
jgi:hypothetical protein